MRAERIRVTGTVQGVGFRPTVWRLANECGLVGGVRNDAEGVLIEAWGQNSALDRFVDRLRTERPPLAIIEAIRRTALEQVLPLPYTFEIRQSVEGRTATNVAADAATCDACLADIRDPDNRRYRYPFTNCTHCGPRLSIVRHVPYDRANTSMAAFDMCPACLAEYVNPADRRFHAQPNACPSCGPQAWLEDSAGQRIDTGADDAIAAAARRLVAGEIVAIKGIGGFHLACIATDAAAVARLRQRKHRYQKALAMMARDLDVIDAYAAVGDADRQRLTSAEAPIVVLRAEGTALPDAIAPGQNTLGFMLPYTPLHHLLLADIDVPVVMTSGNRSDEPQVTDNEDARVRLAGIADVFLMHDRDIVNRLDDSVLQGTGSDVQVLRRARGFAPEPIALHDSFAAAGDVLALGGELKNTFCLLRDGKALVSQHVGDMEEAEVVRDFMRNLDLYAGMFDAEPDIVAVDAHPEYVPSKFGLAQFADRRIVRVQHHHAHVASCMAEHGLALETPPVLGIVLDGLGYGDDGTFWGGEILRADFGGYERVARFAPVAMPGGTRAMREPWRNAWAHLHAAFGDSFGADRYPGLDALRTLQRKPVGVLAAMHARDINSPLASSAGRLFDATAALLGVCTDEQAHEAQAAMELETLAECCFECERQNGYPLDVDTDGLVTVSWRSLWTALLDDLQAGVARPVIAARFHAGLVGGLGRLAVDLAREHDLANVVLSGGVFQNTLLRLGLADDLKDAGLRVLSPTALPANDGGLALGQAAIAACRAIAGKPESRHIGHTQAV